jgi:hypothetical protein
LHRPPHGSADSDSKQKKLVLRKKEVAAEKKGAKAPQHSSDQIDDKKLVLSLPLAVNNDYEK